MHIAFDLDFSHMHMPEINFYAKLI